MKEDKEDFGLTPVNTPLDRVVLSSAEDRLEMIRRMEMSLFVVPRRLVKIKRLVDIMTVEDKKDV